MIRNEWKTIPLSTLVTIGGESIDPQRSPGTAFHLFSIPAYDAGKVPETILGVDIGSVKRTVEPGDCLFSKLNPRINRVWVVPPKAENRQIATPEFLPLRAKPGVNLLPSFLAYLLSWKGFRDEVVGREEAATKSRSRLKPDQLLSKRIPYPSLSEQEGVVRMLDEAEELRKLRTQADRRTADLIPALFHDMFSKLDEIKRYPVRPLSVVAEVVSGVAKGRHFNGQTPVTVPYIRVANVQAGYLDLSEIKTIEALPSEVKELTLKRGDLLLTEGGDFDKLGRGAMWEHEIPNCIHQNHIFRVRVAQSKLLPIYFEKFLQTPTARTYFLKCAKRTTNLASINMTQLRGLPVPIPPLSLQREFAVHVAEIRTMVSHQATSRRRLNDLFQSLLHRAFAGQL